MSQTLSYLPSLIHFILGKVNMTIIDGVFCNIHGVAQTDHVYFEAR